jgi:hypothetical protein
MDRLLSMIFNMVLRRGLRSLFRPARKPPGPRTPQDAATRETAKRMRDTQRMMRRLGR